MTTQSLAAPAAFHVPRRVAVSRRRHRLPAAPTVLLRCVLLAVSVGVWCLVFEALQRLAVALHAHAWRRRMAAQWARGLGVMLSVLLNIRFEISPELRERASSLRRAIIVANHQSPLDILAMLLLRPAQPLRFIARAGLGRGLPGVSTFLRMPGQVLLRKGDPMANVRALNSLGSAIEQTGDNVIIFPEGTKTARTYAEVRRFKATGLGAIRTGAPSAPIIVVAIKDAHAAWRGVGHLLGRNITVRLELADEIPPQAAAALDDGALAAACERAVRGVLAGARAA